MTSNGAGSSPNHDLPLDIRTEGINTFSAMLIQTFSCFGGIGVSSVAKLVVVMIGEEIVKRSGRPIKKPSLVGTREGQL